MRCGRADGAQEPGRGGSKGAGGGRATYGAPWGAGGRRPRSIAKRGRGSNQGGGCKPWVGQGDGGVVARLLQWSQPPPHPKSMAPVASPLLPQLPARAGGTPPGEVRATQQVGWGAGRALALHLVPSGLSPDVQSTHVLHTWPEPQATNQPTNSSPVTHSARCPAAAELLAWVTGASGPAALPYCPCPPWTGMPSPPLPSPPCPLHQPARPTQPNRLTNHQLAVGCRCGQAP